MPKQRKMIYKNLIIDQYNQIDGAQLREVQQLYRVTENKTVKKIVEFIRTNNPETVSEIYFGLSLDQSYTSQKLALLRKHGLVFVQKSGKERYYRVDSEKFNQVDELKKQVSKSRIRALANKTRLSILQLLIDNDKMSVTDIYIALKIEQSPASNMLAILLKAGFVGYNVDGKGHVYYVHYTTLETVRVAFEKYFEPAEVI